jgi:parallel beta-helix repeat protein
MIIRLLFYACVLLISSAEAATYYVRTGGSDSHSCTQAQTDSDATAKATLQSVLGCPAFDSVGNTIIVHGGNYDNTGGQGDNGAVAIWSSSRGNDWASANTLKAADGETVWLNGFLSLSDAINPAHGGGFRRNRYWIIQRININCGGPYGGFVGSDVEFSRLTDVEIKNCRAGISTGGDGMEFINTHVHHIGIPQSLCENDPGRQANCYGIYYLGSNGLIQGGFWHDIALYCLHIYNASFTNFNVTIRNNTLTRCGVGHYSWADYGPAIGAFSSGHTITNNVIYGTDHGGMYLSGGNSIYNNTVYGNTDGGIFTNAGEGNLNIANNIVFNNSGGNIDVASGTFSSNLCNNIGSGCTISTSDPQFANAPGGDFHLTNGSPAINAGINLAGIPTTDIEGNPRVGATDIGAYECQNAGGVDCESTPPQPIGPVVNYKCDGNLNDAENGFTATGSGVLTNGTPIVGSTGNSCVFDGINDFLSAPNDPAFRPANFCFGIWAKPSVLPAVDTVCRLMEIGTTAALGFNGGAGTLFGFINNGPTVAGAQNVVTSTAHLFGLSYDAASGMLRLWDNNSNVASLAVGAGTPLSYSGSPTLVVGGSTVGGTPGWCNIEVDNIRMNDAACTPLGMQQWYSENPLPQPGTTSSHWRFYQADAAEGTTIAGSGVDAAGIVVSRSAKIRQRWNVKRNGSTISEHFLTECNLNGGSFSPIDNSCASRPACIAADSAKNMGDATTNLLPTDGFTFVAGRFVVDTLNSGLQTTVADGQVTEWETSYAFNQSLVDTDVVRCRLRTAAGDFGVNGYPPTLPTMTIFVPGGLAGGAAISGGTSRGGVRN